MNCKSMSHHFAILKEDAHSVLLNSIGFFVKNSLAFEDLGNGRTAYTDITQLYCVATA